MLGAALVLSAVCAVLTSAASTAGAGRHAAGASPPPKPQPCKGTVGGLLGVVKSGTASPEPLCGTGGRDRLTAVGGGDTVWGYQEDDVLKARNGKVDLVYGGPGADSGAFDKCDTVYEVEVVQPDAPACAGVKERTLAARRASAPGPYWHPVIECVDNREVPGQWRVKFIKQPTMRAIDTTDAVDWQFVAWTPVLYKWDGTEWKLKSTHRRWLWDLTYDTQATAFPGNFWRSFETNERLFLWFNVSEPGTYRIRIRYHWYEGDGGEPAADWSSFAKKHYGDYEDPTRQSCVFPAPTAPPPAPG
jgi:hypothetical protein